MDASYLYTLAGISIGANPPSSSLALQRSDRYASAGISDRPYDSGFQINQGQLEISQVASAIDKAIESGDYGKAMDMIRQNSSELQAVGVDVNTMLKQLEEEQFRHKVMEAMKTGDYEQARDLVKESGGLLTQVKKDEFIQIINNNETAMGIVNQAFDLAINGKYESAVAAVDRKSALLVRAGFDIEDIKRILEKRRDAAPYMEQFNRLISDGKYDDAVSLIDRKNALLMEAGYGTEELEGLKSAAKQGSRAAPVMGQIDELMNAGKYKDAMALFEKKSGLYGDENNVVSQKAGLALDRAFAFARQGRAREAIASLKAALPELEQAKALSDKEKENVKKTIEMIQTSIDALTRYQEASDSFDVDQTIQVLRSKKEELKRIGVDVESRIKELEEAKLIIVLKPDGTFEVKRGGEDTETVRQMQRYLCGTTDSTGRPYMFVVAGKPLGIIDDQTVIAANNFMQNESLISSGQPVMTGERMLEEQMNDTAFAGRMISISDDTIDKMKAASEKNCHMLPLSAMIRTSVLGKALIDKIPGLSAYNDSVLVSLIVDVLRQRREEGSVLAAVEASLVRGEGNIDIGVLNRFMEMCGKSDIEGISLDLAAHRPSGNGVKALPVVRVNTYTKLIQEVTEETAFPGQVPSYIKIYGRGTDAATYEPLVYFKMVQSRNGLPFASDVSAPFLTSEDMRLISESLSAFASGMIGAYALESEGTTTVVTAELERAKSENNDELASVMRKYLGTLMLSGEDAVFIGGLIKKMSADKIDVLFAGNKHAPDLLDSMKSKLAKPGGAELSKDESDILRSLLSSEEISGAIDAGELERAAGIFYKNSEVSPAEKQALSGRLSELQKEAIGEITADPALRDYLTLEVSRYAEGNVPLEVLWIFINANGGQGKFNGEKTQKYCALFTLGSRGINPNPQSITEGEKRSLQALERKAQESKRLYYSDLERLAKSGEGDERHGATVLLSRIRNSRSGLMERQEKWYELYPLPESIGVPPPQACAMAKVKLLYAQEKGLVARRKSLSVEIEAVNESIKNTENEISRLKLDQAEKGYTDALAQTITLKAKEASEHKMKLSALQTELVGINSFIHGDNISRDFFLWFVKKYVPENPSRIAASLGMQALGIGYKQDRAGRIENVNAAEVCRILGSADKVLLKNLPTWETFGFASLLEGSEGGQELTEEQKQAIREVKHAFSFFVSNASMSGELGEEKVSLINMALAETFRSIFMPWTSVGQQFMDPAQRLKMTALDISRMVMFEGQDFSKEEIEKFKQDIESSNTKDITRTDVKVVKKFLELIDDESITREASKLIASLEEASRWDGEGKLRIDRETAQILYNLIQELNKDNTVYRSGDYSSQELSGASSGFFGDFGRYMIPFANADFWSTTVDHASKRMQNTSIGEELLEGAGSLVSGYLGQRMMLEMMMPLYIRYGLPLQYAYNMTRYAFSGDVSRSQVTTDMTTGALRLPLTFFMYRNLPLIWYRKAYKELQEGNVMGALAHASVATFVTSRGGWNSIWGNLATMDRYLYSRPFWPATRHLVAKHPEKAKGLIRYWFENPDVARDQESSWFDRKMASFADASRTPLGRLGYLDWIGRLTDKSHESYARSYSQGEKGLAAAVFDKPLVYMDSAMSKVGELSVDLAQTRGLLRLLTNAGKIRKSEKTVFDKNGTLQIEDVSLPEVAPQQTEIDQQKMEADITKVRTQSDILINDNKGDVPGFWKKFSEKMKQADLSDIERRVWLRAALYFRTLESGSFGKRMYDEQVEALYRYHAVPDIFLQIKTGQGKSFSTVLGAYEEVLSARNNPDNYAKANYILLSEGGLREQLCRDDAVQVARRGGVQVCVIMDDKTYDVDGNGKMVENKGRTPEQLYEEAGQKGMIIALTYQEQAKNLSSGVIDITKIPRGCNWLEEVDWATVENAMTRYLLSSPGGMEYNEIVKWYGSARNFLSWRSTKNHFLRALAQTGQDPKDFFIQNRPRGIDYDTWERRYDALVQASDINNSYRYIQKDEQGDAFRQGTRQDFESRLRGGSLIEVFGKQCSTADEAVAAAERHYSDVRRQYHMDPQSLVILSDTNEPELQKLFGGFIDPALKILNGRRAVGGQMATFADTDIFAIMAHAIKNKGSTGTAGIFADIFDEVYKIPVCTIDPFVPEERLTDAVLRDDSARQAMMDKIVNTATDPKGAKYEGINVRLKIIDSTSASCATERNDFLLELNRKLHAASANQDAVKLISEPPMRIYIDPKDEFRAASARAVETAKNGGIYLVTANSADEVEEIRGMIAQQLGTGQIKQGQIITDANGQRFQVLLLSERHVKPGQQARLLKGLKGNYESGVGTIIVNDNLYRGYDIFADLGLESPVRIGGEECGFIKAEGVHVDAVGGARSEANLVQSLGRAARAMFTGTRVHSLNLSSTDNPFYRHLEEAVRQANSDLFSDRESVIAFIKNRAGSSGYIDIEPDSRDSHMIILNKILDNCREIARGELLRQILEAKETGKITAEAGARITRIKNAAYRGPDELARTVISEAAERMVAESGNTGAPIARDEVTKMEESLCRLADPSLVLRRKSVDLSLLVDKTPQEARMALEEMLLGRFYGSTNASRYFSGDFYFAKVLTVVQNIYAEYKIAEEVARERGNEGLGSKLAIVASKHHADLLTTIMDKVMHFRGNIAVTEAHFRAKHTSGKPATGNTPSGDQAGAHRPGPAGQASPAQEEPDQSRALAAGEDDAQGVKRTPEPSSRPVSANLDDAHREYLDLLRTRKVANIQPDELDAIARNNGVTADQLRARISSTSTPSGAQSGSITPEQAAALNSASPADAAKAQELAQMIIEGLIAPKARWLDSETARLIGPVVVLADAEFERIRLEGDAAYVRGDDGKYTIYVRGSAVPVDEDGKLTLEGCSRTTRAVAHELAEIYVVTNNPGMDPAERSVMAHFVASQIEEQVSAGYLKAPQADLKSSISGWASSAYEKLKGIAESAPKIAGEMAGEAVSNANRSIYVGGRMGFGMSLVMTVGHEILWGNGFQNLDEREYWSAALGQAWDGAVRAAVFASRDNTIQDVLMQRLFNTNYSKPELWANCPAIRKMGFTTLNMGAMAVSGVFDDVLMWLDMPIDERIKPYLPENLKYRDGLKNKDLADTGNEYIDEYYYKMTTMKMIQGAVSNMAFEIPALAANKVPFLGKKGVKIAAGVAINFGSRAIFDNTIIASINEEYLGKEGINGKEREAGLIEKYAKGDIQYVESLTPLHDFAQMIFSSKKNLEILTSTADFLKKPIEATLSAGIPGQALRYVAGRSAEQATKSFFATAFSSYYAAKFGFSRGVDTGESVGNYSLNATTALGGGGAIGLGTGVLTFGFSKAALSLGPIGIVAGGLGFLGGVTYQIIDTQNKIFEEREWLIKKEEEKNKMLGIAWARNGWVSGTVNGGIKTLEEARMIYPQVPDSELSNIVLMSNLGFNTINGSSVEMLDASQDTTYMGITLVLGTRDKVIARNFYNLNDSFAKGRWKAAYSEEEFIDRLCPNWRYLVSEQSGQREIFENRLNAIYNSDTVKNFIRMNKEGIAARNIADFYLADPSLIRKILPRDFWKESGISPVITRDEQEDIARENAAFFDDYVSFIADNLSEESLEEFGRQAEDQITEEQAAYFRNEAISNYLTISNILEMSDEQRAFLRRSGFSDRLYLDELRSYGNLWEEVKTALSKDGILLQECVKRGLAIPALDAASPEMLRDVIFSAIQVFMQKRGVPNISATQIIDSDRLILTALNEALQTSPSLQEPVSLREIASSQGKKAVTLIELSKHKELFSEVCEKLEQSGALSERLSITELSEKQQYEALSAALKLYQQKRGFVVDQNIDLIDSSIAIQLISTYSRSRTHYVGGLRGMASGGRR